MGASSSTELAKPFADITKWPKSRVESVVKSYHEGEYDFGIDHSVVMSLTGYEADEAKELLSALAKNDSGIINAITLLIAIIALGNSENRNEIRRLEQIFDLMDFNKNSKMSIDEMTILLLCISSAFSFILEGKCSDDLAQAHEASVMSYARHILDSLNKRSSSFITKDEFCHWVKENVFGQQLININDIFEEMVTYLDKINEAKNQQTDDAAEEQKK